MMMLGVSSRAACARFAGALAAGEAARQSSTETPAHCEQALRRRMTAIGKFSLLSETAAAPSVPAVLLTLRGPEIGADRIRSLLLEKIVPASPRFRSRVDATALEFVDDLGERGAPPVLDGAPGAPLPKAVAEVLSTPLAGARGGDAPWWEATRFPRREGTAILLRAHHCLADGVSLAALFSRLTDQADEIDAAVAAEVTKRRRRTGRQAAKWKRLLRKLARAVGFLFRLVGAALATVRVLATAKAPLRGARLRFPDRAGTRSVAWASRFATVSSLKRVAKALGGEAATVNDVYAAVVAGALRAVLPGAPSEVACAVPVHLYGGALLPGVAVGNHIGAVVVSLPLPAADGADDAGHVARVSASVGGSLRGGARAVFAYGAAYAAGALLPRCLVPRAMAMSAGCATVALTNVRGPPVDALSIDGRPVADVVPFLPPPPGCPVGVALTTIGDDATICVNADAGLVDADALLDAALAYYAALLERADRAR